MKQRYIGLILLCLLVPILFAARVRWESLGPLVGYAPASLPTPATVGLLARLSSGGATNAIVVDDGGQWRCNEEHSQNRAIVTCPPYNATGNGATDDAAAFQAAIDAMELAGGGEVYVPASPTAYRLLSGLTINSSDVSLRGAGRGASTIDFDFDTATGLTIGTAAILNTLVADLTLTHSTSRSAGATVVVDRAARTTIRNIHIDQAFTAVQMGVATFTTGTIFLNIDNSRFDCAGNCVLVHSQAGFWMNNSHINGSAPGSNRLGIFIDGQGQAFDTAYISNHLNETCDTGFRIGGLGASNVWVTNGVWDGIEDVGIHIEPAAAASAGNIQVLNNWLSGSASAVTDNGILINEVATATVSHILLSNTYITDMSQRAIWVAGGVDDVVIRGTISQNGGTNAAESGIDLDAAVAPPTNVVIANNRIRGSHNLALSLPDAVDPVVVIGNDFANVVTAGISNVATWSLTKSILGNANSNEDSLTLGGGATIANILSASASLDFPSTANNTCEELPVTVTGAAVGDPVFIGPSSGGGGSASETIVWGWVTAANTVTVKHCVIGGGPVDLGAELFRVVTMNIGRD